MPLPELYRPLSKPSCPRFFRTPFCQRTALAGPLPVWAYPATWPAGSKTYTIKAGDTLWGLAQQFFKNAYMWPQLWETNTWITDAHWIYPGDVLLIEGDGAFLRHRFAIGYSPELAANLRIPLGQGITGTAAATGHSVRVSDTSKDPRYINAIDSVRSELAVPLMLRGKCIGVLDIQSRHLDYFTRDQQNILTLLASRLAVAIENARLFEKVRTQADTLLLLSEVGRETGSILEVEELLRRAAEQTKRVIDYQILSIMLYDEEQKVFRHRVDVKHGHRVQGKLRVAVSEGIVGAAATLKEPVLVPDVSTDSRYLMVNPETKSELAIPMMHQGKVIGVLDLESPQLNYFTDDHVQTLSILASRRKKRDSNAISRRQKGFRARFCGPCPPKITDSIWPRGTCLPAKSAATSTSFCATVRSNWESLWAT